MTDSQYFNDGTDSNDHGQIKPPEFAEPLSGMVPATPPEPVTPAPNDSLDFQANLIIAGGVAAAAGIGFAPVFIDAAWLVASNGGMVSALAVLYKYKMTGDNLRGFILRLIEDSGLTFASVKALATAIKLTGIGFLPGVALNGALNAALTLAIGKAAHHAFKHRGAIPDDELVKFFKKSLGMGE